MDDAQRGQVQRSAAAVYEEFFVPALFDQWPPQLLDAAGVGAGSRVLDVGCGTGVVARAAAERAGPRGYVAALDPNDGMLDVARGISDAVDWREGTAEAMPFGDASFDAVLCQHALMFFEDRAAAAAEMARVLAPGGHIALATWAAVEESPGYARMVALIRRLFGKEPAAALLAPFSLGTEAALRETLSGAFPAVTVERREGVARFASIADWVRTDVRGWTLADLLDDAMEARLLTAAEAELATFTDADGRVRFPAPALFATATV